MMEHLPRILRVLRAEYGFPQKAMADKLGISIAQYSKIENGEKPLHIENLIKLSDIFRLTPWELLEDIIKADSTEGYLKLRAHEQANKSEHDEKKDGEEVAFYKKLSDHFEQKYLELFSKFSERNQE